MSEVPSVSDVAYGRYLFEYRHSGAEWGFEVLARSPEEAKDRLKAMTWARYKGEVKAKVRIPTGRLVERLIGRFLG